MPLNKPNSTKIDVEGGKLLAQLRQGKDLTQSELAKRADVSRSMVAQLEIGERRPSRKLIHTLCQAMGVSDDDEQQALLAYDFSPSGEPSEQIAAVLRADKNLTSQQAEQIADLVKKAYAQYAARKK